MARMYSNWEEGKKRNLVRFVRIGECETASAELKNE